ncbi:MAG: hypothetical protein D3905_16410, partial [Candidatus Electrothrix sp. AS4_5]|nr:hypothetical protein [Candidatus Electrothrix gigas]
EWNNPTFICQIYRERDLVRIREIPIILPKEDITKAVELAESISSIRNKKVYFDGDESLWNDIFRAN